MSDVKSVVKVVGILTVGAASFVTYMLTVNKKLQGFTKSQRDVFYKISCSRKSDEIPKRVKFDKKFMSKLSNIREKKICNAFVKGKAASGLVYDDVFYEKGISNVSSNTAQRFKQGLSEAMSFYIQPGTSASPVIQVTEVERLVFPADRERRMKVGDIVYCIGDIVLKNSKKASLKPPSDGSGYIFSTEDILVQYIDFLVIKKRWQTLKMLGVGLTAAIVSVGICWYYWRHKKDESDKGQLQRTQRTVLNPISKKIHNALINIVLNGDFPYKQSRLGLLLEININLQKIQKKNINKSHTE